MVDIKMFLMRIISLKVDWRIYEKWNEDSKMI